MKKFQIKVFEPKRWQRILLYVAMTLFAALASPPQILLCILLAFPAFTGWIVPYFLYKKLVAARTRKVIPMIEAKYDEMYELCEKGNKLLYI